jgi:hypothetical protein
MRLKGSTLVIIGALVGLALVYLTGQIAPAATAYQAQLRIWLAARASGIVALLLLTVQVELGLLLSHPTNQTTWRLSRLVFPWHENLFVFIVAFVVAHVVSIVLDPYAGVGLGGALIPGLSAYRTVPVALGSLGLYALLITGLTARYTQRLPAGWWLQIHRLSFLVLALVWLHGMEAGTDALALRPLYVAIAVLVGFGAAYRYWVVRATLRRGGPPAPQDVRIPDVAPAAGGPVALGRAAWPTVEPSIRPPDAGVSSGHSLPVTSGGTDR